MNTYPTHFHDVEEVKEYINTTCKQSGNQYITTKQFLTKQELAYIKDKVCFVVACKAFKQGEFYLEVGLVDRPALRAAVEADIRRLLPLVPYWPSYFPGVEDALVHVDGVARWKDFTYTRFEGVEQERFRRYVKFNTVRHAYEDGHFDMQVPGEDWRCRKSKSREQEKKPVSGPKARGSKLTTMNGAIESDIQELFTRIPTWLPTFPSLNAARNYVADFSRYIHFSYTYWADVEPNRFRLIVNFNTAKLAFRRGKFKIWEGYEEEDSVDTDETAVESTEVKETEREVSSLAYRIRSTGSTVTPPVETPVFSTATAFGDAIDSINTAIADTTVDDVPDLLLEELPESISIVGEEIQEPIMSPQETITPFLVEIDEDPFKDLIAVLKRESILKEAFE
ncbi:uncharacterized protein J4E84_005467 [Alternaria hordeiaustralica]|uniref:uncharacterized protein n=1 Tax=Alternaria hordeiaustralica TaxID=1187925 RepID=UPI0020C51790|nr:uncharacterized protein J4E84_005467 [Alternaria hordeiaustralica]KAI4687096.1 hypothetical protein J4E84_005467 [Alternaria hordeiaustralica]